MLLQRGSTAAFSWTVKPAFCSTVRASSAVRLRTLGTIGLRSGSGLIGGSENLADTDTGASPMVKVHVSDVASAQAPPHPSKTFARLAVAVRVISVPAASSESH